LADTIAILEGKRVKWMLGMGTFWLDYVRERMLPRINALARLDQVDESGAKMIVLPVVLKEL
jgi:hypothetical protein